MEKVYHGNSNQKKAKSAILISDKVGFIANKITTDRERRFIIKGSVPTLIQEFYMPVHQTTKQPCEAKNYR